MQETDYTDEMEEAEESPRVDKDFFCALRLRSILVVDGVCFSRTHNRDCRQCVFDKGPGDRILARLIWVLVDMLEDRAAEERRQRSGHSL